MRYIDVNEQELKKLIERRFEMETAEATVHPFFEQNEKKVFKLFKSEIDINNKTKKIIALSERLKNVDFVITAESIIRYKGKTIGYIMPYKDGKLFDTLSFRKKDNITVLKDIADKLKTLHSLGIVCGDLIDNIIVDENKNVYFIDHDNFSIDDFKIDTKTRMLRNYLKKISTLDYRYDNYVLNLLTLSIITRIIPSYLELQYTIDYSRFCFRDEEINRIVDNTFNLSESYDEDLIVDKIETDKDLRKIRTRIF